MKLINSLMAVLCLTGIARVSAAEPAAMDQTRSTLEQWVQTRQLVSKTQSDWQADKESLEQTVALYERELQALAEQMAKVSTNNTQVAKEMDEALALQKTSNETLAGARKFATDFEGQVKQLAPQLPAPLQDILKPTLAKMPTDPATTKMLAAERLQVLVGALNELDKFNNSVNVFNEKRKDSQGNEVAVQSVYVGLGTAYFVNEAGDFAGTGAPGLKGWDWTINNSIAATVQSAVKIYRNERAAQFLALPATVH